MSDPRSTAAYRLLLRAYPRAFRAEYEPDMVLLFNEQLRDESSARVWARTAIDLASTVPLQHLEAHMHASPNRAVPVVFTALSVTGLLFALVLGSSLSLSAFGALGAVVFGVLAAASWRRTRMIGTGAASHWWKVLAGGGGALVTTIVVLNIVGQLGDGWWAPAMLVLFSSLVTTVVGLILGVAHLTTRHTRAAA